MKAEDFDMFCSLLRQRSGLVLSRDKAYLLESRLTPVARKWNMKSLDELANHLRSRKDEELITEITDAMTTNESSFFRDNKPFQLFRESVLPMLQENRGSQKKIRIWSAACSSGQEPYSLAMLLKDEEQKLRGWNIEILGTDLSKDMIERAKSGVYSQFEVQRGLPIQYLVKHFKQVGDKWEINEDLKRMVKFRVHNLLEDLNQLGKFDVVFCRNVLIYFDQQTKKRVLEDIAKIMPKDGALFLGGAETVLGITDRFKPMPGLRGVYTVAENDSAGSGKAAAQ